MNLSQFVLILQAHLRVILLILSITVLVALGISLTQSNCYAK